MSFQTLSYFSCYSELLAIMKRMKSKSEDLCSFWGFFSDSSDSFLTVKSKHGTSHDRRSQSTFIQVGREQKRDKHRTHDSILQKQIISRHEFHLTSGVLGDCFSLIWDHGSPTWWFIKAQNVWNLEIRDKCQRKRRMHVGCSAIVFLASRAWPTFHETPLEDSRVGPEAWRPEPQHLSLINDPKPRRKIFTSFGWSFVAWGLPPRIHDSSFHKKSWNKKNGGNQLTREREGGRRTQAT